MNKFMSTSIVKEFKFEAAHRLSLGYVGKCANLHGHSYKVYIEIQAYELNNFDMVIDFGDLKPLKEGIMVMFDHKTILHEDDPLVDALRKDQGFESVFTTGRNPTCETIAEILFDLAESALDLIFSEGQLPNTSMTPKVIAVTVQETATGRATVRRSMYA